MCGFDHGMVVGARQAGVSISETANLLGKPKQNKTSEYFPNTIYMCVTAQV